MKKTGSNLQEQIIINSLGILDKEQIKDLEIKNLSDENKKEVSEFNNLTFLFTKILSSTLRDVSPSEKVKEKLFKKINEKSSDAKMKAFDFIYADSDDWMQHPIDGIKVKQLAANEEKGYIMLLMKVAAGTSYPPHHHSSAEECYVIEGDFFAEGKTLGPGDFHHADGGSDHEPLHTKNGCTLLLVVDPNDYK